jgi:two-component system CheB/CheR fusion protein
MSPRKKSPRKPPLAIVKPVSHRVAGGSDATGAAPLTVVALGASAGGLEALSQLLVALPPDTGMSFVVIQHLAPEHESSLVDILSGRAGIPVVTATENAALKADTVYVIPPGVTMSVLEGRLHLFDRVAGRTPQAPVDFFFRSLAESFQERAIGIVLSGSASDGTLGIQEIKGMGGITIAQDPATAAFDGMPRSAIATGQIDMILPPAEIGVELGRISRSVATSRPRAGEDVDISAAQFGRIFELLHRATGVDFTHYKQPTLRRRIQRRMLVHKIPGVNDYIRLLTDSPEETALLFNDILIRVTRFFRDPESFVALRESVFPKLVERWNESSPLRIWVVGCSTGEEVYSMAVELLEFLGDRDGHPPIQIFGTDISESAIEQARAGAYPASIADDVGPERLSRFFVAADSGYRIARFVRDLCIFARQDVTHDPPFSKLDLLVCRNVLIYLGPVLQKRLLAMFEYALKPGGFMMLGGAETTGLYNGGFAVVDKKNRIYSRKADSSGRHKAIHRPTGRVDASPLRPTSGPVEGAGIVDQANQAILERFAPPGVIVDSDLQITQFRGQTGSFLEPAPGDATLNLLKMAREGLLHGLRSAFNEARTSQAAARREGLRIEGRDRTRIVDVEVIPLMPSARGRHYVVLFQERSTVAADRDRSEKKSPGEAPQSDDERSLKLLREELSASRDYLQSIIHDLEAANEELQSANEEILSSNEELQSTNEELDTAKEELQSTNEELNTINDELSGRNEELGRVNSDLVNLLGSVQIAIVIVSSDLGIRRFTPMAQKLFNLLPADVGRSIAHIKPDFQDVDLEKLIGEVVSEVRAIEREIQDSKGNWFSLRIRPYKTLDNRIDGAVMTLFDIGVLKKQQIELTRVRDLNRAVIETVRDPLIVVSREFVVQNVNRAFCRVFAVSPADVEGKNVHDLENGQWELADLRTLLEELRDRNTAFEGYRIDLRLLGDGTRSFDINATQIDPSDPNGLILLEMKEADGSKSRETS